MGMHEWVRLLRDQIPHYTSHMGLKSVHKFYTMSPAVAEATMAGSSNFVAERLAAMSACADCTLRSKDRKEFRVHIVKLVEQSLVLRSLLSEIRTAELDLSERGTDVQLLVAGMYDATLPLTWENMGALLELARKYDVHDIRRNCESALRATPLHMDNLPRVLSLAATYGLNDLVATCLEFIAANDRFQQLKRKHGEKWYHNLPAAALVELLEGQIAPLQRRREKCDAEHHHGAVPNKAEIKAEKDTACL